MKVLISDYDGTLFLDSGYRKADLKAIRQFQNEGNLFGLCSGRPFSYLWNLESGELHFDFIISSTGACISLDRDLIIEQKFVFYEDFVQISKCCGLQEMAVITKDAAYVHSLGWGSSSLVSLDPVIMTSIDQISEPIIQISIEKKTEQEASALYERLNAMGLSCSIFLNGVFLDIVGSDCSKGGAIRKLARHLGMEEKDMACIGDNFNDLPMFETIPNSFSFPYAPEKVQEKAKTIVDSIAQAIECLENE